jgi:outer membrane protein assembly factor BamE (lipoprotein component of BamABCDE complex)
MASSPALTGCAYIAAPVTAQRGYIVNETDLEKLKIGQTSQEQVQEYMGSPSTISTINNEAWYYITSKTEAYLFYPPKEVERTVIAVYFNKQNVIDDITYYGLKDGEVIDIQTRTTPTRGKELTILGQLFSNLGRFNKKPEANKAIPQPGGHQ